MAPSDVIIEEDGLTFSEAFLGELRLPEPEAPVVVEAPPPVSDPTPVRAEAETPNTRAQAYVLEIDGLVIDETRSKMGRTFYEVFYSRWNPPKGLYNYTITVREQPLPSRGTRVQVLVSGDLAFQARLQPKYEQNEEAAHEAIRYTARFLMNRSPMLKGL